MRNIDIIKTFEPQEMGKFLASIVMQERWNNWKDNKEWLEKECEDGILRRGYMMWVNEEWIFDKESRKDAYRGNWVLQNLPEILEFLLSKGTIKTNNVLVVIPTIESNRRQYEDYKDLIHYKGYNFTVWSDFFDYKQEDIMSSHQGEVDYRKYLDTYKIADFMKNFADLVTTIKIYYKDK